MHLFEMNYYHYQYEWKLRRNINYNKRYRGIERYFKFDLLSIECTTDVNLERKIGSFHFIPLFISRYLYEYSMTIIITIVRYRLIIFAIPIATFLGLVLVIFLRIKSQARRRKFLSTFDRNTENWIRVEIL